MSERKPDAYKCQVCSRLTHTKSETPGCLHPATSLIPLYRTPPDLEASLAACREALEKLRARIESTYLPERPRKELNAIIDAALAQPVKPAESGAVLAWQYRRERDEARAQLAALRDAAQRALVVCEESVLTMEKVGAVDPAESRRVTEELRAALKAEPDPAGGSDDG